MTGVLTGGGFADPAVAARLVAEIREAAGPHQYALMEVCGGQTHSIIRNGIDELLAGSVELIHGPGCPVCVTPLEMIDRSLAIAAQPNVIMCSFGDMLRVPGSHQDLFKVRAAGADVRVVYSPLDAVQIAQDNPDKQVVFFAVGFETTAPANGMAAELARRQGVTNFSLLVSHVLVPPAIEAICDAPDCRVQAFLAAGHVCTVMGTGEYFPLAEKYQTPIVVTGFEPLDVLAGIRLAVRQLATGRAEVENAYTRAVAPQGNPAAQALIKQVFEVCDRTWRGIGTIGDSGWRLREEYAAHDAEKRFEVSDVVADESPDCQAGAVLRGQIKPDQCPAFGRICTPLNPLGAPMVSSEGACAAYYQFRR